MQPSLLNVRHIKTEECCLTLSRRERDRVGRLGGVHIPLNSLPLNHCTADAAEKGSS